MLPALAAFIQQRIRRVYRRQRPTPLPSHMVKDRHQLQLGVDGFDVAHAPSVDPASRAGTSVRSGEPHADDQRINSMPLRERRVSLGDLVARMVAFVRAGYPQQRRLSDDAIIGVAFELARRGAKPIDGTDIRVVINEITDEMPSPADTDRVRRRLESAGWQVIDDFDVAG